MNLDQNLMHSIKTGIIILENEKSMKPNERKGFTLKGLSIVEAMDIKENYFKDYTVSITHSEKLNEKYTLNAQNKEKVQNA